jgi:alkylation response protein AidB-like acyl-CoA dehydrogenase
MSTWAPFVPDIDMSVAEFVAIAAHLADDVAGLLGAQYDCGLAWPEFDLGWGGLGLSSDAAADVRARVAALSLPPSSGDFVALHQVARLIHDVGTDEQKQRFLRRIFTGEDHWCQLFSEPDAGSDLAGLATAAVKDANGGWRVTGQKVWTSGARHANWSLLLARTDPSAVKHRGMTMLILDMSAPGVEVRPLRQADGGARFSEVFLDDVRVPDDLRIGAVGEGWATALKVLGTERVGASDVFLRPVGELLTALRQIPDRDPRKASLRDEVVRVWIARRTIELTAARMRASRDAAEVSRLASLAKVTASEHSQHLAQVLASLVGPDILVQADYDEALARDEDPESAAGLPDLSSLSPARFLIRSRAMSIEGGTSEIGRNLIGERILGLPPDLRVDKDKPWQEIRRT